MKSILYLIAIPAILLTNAIAKAQTPIPPDIGNPSQIDTRPIQQPGAVFDSNNGSRQFFQQGRDKLFLLPQEKSEPILQIDEEIEQGIEENPSKIEENQEPLE